MRYDARFIARLLFRLHDRRGCRCKSPWRARALLKKPEQPLLGPPRSLSCGVPRHRQCFHGNTLFDAVFVRSAVLVISSVSSHTGSIDECRNTLKSCLASAIIVYPMFRNAYLSLSDGTEGWKLAFCRCPLSTSQGRHFDVESKTCLREHCTPHRERTEEMDRDMQQSGKSELGMDAEYLSS